MKSQLIFFNPGKVYRGKTLKDISDSYYKMAFTGFDKLIKFDPEYDLDTPDFYKEVWEKDGKPIMLTFFGGEPVLGIGNIINKFPASSYLLNPVLGGNSEVYYPDMDIMEVPNSSETKDAVDKIIQYYQKWGWECYSFDGKISTNKRVSILDKDGNPMKMIDPGHLENLAIEVAGYNPKGLCFPAA